MRRSGSERRREGVVTRVRDPRSAVAGERERVLKVGAPPAPERGEAAEVPDLVGVGLGVQVAYEQRGKRERSLGARDGLDAVHDLQDLRRADVTLVELPVEMRDEERDGPERRGDLGEEKRPPLVRADARQLVNVAPGDGPAREDSVSEPALVARPSVGHVIVEALRDRRRLVEAVAVVGVEPHDLLQPEDVRR